MLQRRTAAAYLPKRLSIATLKEAARHCEGCDLYQHAIQTVFGAGPQSARMMLVGEMPGDEEDREGEPFIGPSGWLLDLALREAGIEREEIYLTNVVKHFRWEPEGKRRLHKKPSARHISACRPWIEAEFEIIKPSVVVCLGATAAQFLLGRKFRVTRDRGKFFASEQGPSIVATHHPSAILRAPTKNIRDRMRLEFTDDLRAAREQLELIDREVRSRSIVSHPSD